MPRLASHPHKIRGAQTRERQELGPSVSTRAYNMLLRGCATYGDSTMARKYFDEMAALDIPADVGTINAIIATYLKASALTAARHTTTDVYQPPSFRDAFGAQAGGQEEDTMQYSG
jgi:pentatricopeptide repeat protein